MSGHKSAAWPLAFVYTALVVYASLFPFLGWRDQGMTPWLYLMAPLPRYWTVFDVVANVLGYVPLGFFLSLALIRSGMANGAVRIGIAVGVVLSFGMETLQVYLPARIPSNLDFFLNAAGTAVGAAGAWILNATGVVRRWSHWRQQLFVSNARGGLVLLALWPVSLLFPLVVPFGLGQVLQRAQARMGDWLADIPGLPVLAQGPGAADPAPVLEWLCIFLGLMIPMLIVCCVLRDGRHRIWAMALVVFVGASATALSAALSFGPGRAWSWVNVQSQGAVFCALLIGLCLLWVSRWVCTSLAVLALGAYVSLVNQLPMDPYFEQALFMWEQGRFIRFHGLAQWLGWLWPYTALVYVMALLLARETKN